MWMSLKEISWMCRKSSWVVEGATRKRAITIYQFPRWIWIWKCLECQPLGWRWSKGPIGAAVDLRPEKWVSACTTVTCQLDPRITSHFRQKLTELPKAEITIWRSHGRVLVQPYPILRIWPPKLCHCICLLLRKRRAPIKLLWSSRTEAIISVLKVLRYLQPNKNDYNKSIIILIL